MLLVINKQQYHCHYYFACKSVSQTDGGSGHWAVKYDMA